VLDGIEECDDGNTISGDGCSVSCQLERGGDPCAGVIPSDDSTLDAVRIASGLTRPIGIAADGRDPRRLYVLEARGTVLLLLDGVLQPSPFLEFPAGKVGGGGEQGLLGLAFHPDYEDNGIFFVNYTRANGDTVISRLRRNPLDPDDALESSEEVLLVVAQPFSNHNGGHLAFGPDDYLYIGLGDGGGGGDPLEAAQSDTTVLGKMLRMDVDSPSPPHAYGIPATNPNAAAGFPLGLIWAKGLRNPWRYSFDRANGDLYIADVGQGVREEVSVQPASSTGGENYGWDIFEGTSCHEPAPFPACPNPPLGFTVPVHEYAHSGPAPTGCSITGGVVYRGCSMPNLHGSYFYADFCSNFVRSFEWTGGPGVANDRDWTADLAPGGGIAINSISSFGEDARGELYIVDIGGEVFRIVPGDS
jgi:hypothetical protein